MDGEAAQFHRLQEAGGNVQLLQLLVRIPGELISAEFSTLLGQRVQGVAKDKVKVRLILPKHFTHNSSV